jgi:DNA-binding CsgD family transcriptional regulator
MTNKLEKIFFLILFGTLLVSNSFSQATYLNEFLGNSVKELPYSLKEAEIKSREYSKLAIETVKFDIIKAKEYSLLSLKLAYKSENDSLLLKSSRTVGILYNMLGNKDSALFFSKIALHYSNTIQNTKNSAILNTLIANSFIGIGKYDSAYNYFNQADKLYEKLNDSVIDPSYFFLKLNKSSLFKELILYDLMLKELFEAKKIADSISDTSFLPQLLGAIAIGYKQSGNVEKAIYYDKEALKYLRKGELDEGVIYTNIGNSFSLLGKIDSALVYYSKAQIVYEYSNVGTIRIQNLALAKAEMYFANNRIEKSKKSINEINEAELTDNQKARYYLLKGKLSNNIETQLVLINLAVKNSLASDDIVNLKNSYYVFYQLQKKSNDNINALSSYENYNKLEDSIFNKEKSLAIQKVVVQKVIEEKNAEITLNKVKYEKDKAEKEKFILFILLGLLISLFILVLVYFKFKSQKQQTIIVKEEKKIIDKENQDIKNELINVSLLSERNIHFLTETKEKLKEIRLSQNKEAKINSLFAITNQFVLAENDKKEYQDKIQEVKDDFFEKISSEVKLTKTEKKLATLLKLNLSTKDIAPMLKVSDNTVEVYRSRLRKKLSIDKDVSFCHYFNSL